MNILTVFHKIEECALEGLKKMIGEYLLPWCLLKSCLVLFGSGPGCVKDSHLYSIKRKDRVYATVMNIKHKNVNFLEILTFLITCILCL